MHGRSASDGGTGLLSSLAGVLVFLTFLLFTVEVLFSLFASSTVTAVTNDAATRAAADGAPPLPHIEADARRNLGAVGAGADFRWELDDTDGDGAADTVVLDVVAHPPRILPPGLGGLSGPAAIHRRARARLEGLQP